MKGIIYKWTCNVSGKSYIGQTVNEKSREKKFLTEGSYSGIKINNARKKYGLSEGVWTKEVLKRLWCKDGREDELRKRLNFWERHYIELYDTVKNGYNTTNGGDCDFSEEVINEMRKKGKEQWENLSEEEKAAHRERSLRYWNDILKKQWENLSEEERNKYKERSALAYKKWRSSVSDEEFYEKVVVCHEGHSISRSMHSSRINRGRKHTDEFKKHLSEINKGQFSPGCKVRKYSEGKTELIEEYDSITAAAKSIGVFKDTLAKYHGANYKGFYWEIDRSDEVKGYRWDKRIKRWISKMRYNGKTYSLGCFKHEEAAHEMYLIAKKKKEEGIFEDWELNHKFEDKIKLYNKYGEKIRNLA